MVILKTSMFVLGLFGLNAASITETVVPTLDQCGKYLTVLSTDYNGSSEWNGMYSLTTKNEVGVYKSITVRECVNVPE